MILSLSEFNDSPIIAETPKHAIHHTFFSQAQSLSPEQSKETWIYGFPIATPAELGRYRPGKGEESRRHCGTCPGIGARHGELRVYKLPVLPCNLGVLNETFLKTLLYHSLLFPLSLSLTLSLCLSLSLSLSPSLSPLPFVLFIEDVVRMVYEYHKLVIPNVFGVSPVFISTAIKLIWERFTHPTRVSLLFLLSSTAFARSFQNFRTSSRIHESLHNVISTGIVSTPFDSTRDNANISLSLLWHFNMIQNTKSLPRIYLDQLFHLLAPIYKPLLSHLCTLLTMAIWSTRKVANGKYSFYN